MGVIVKSLLAQLCMRCVEACALRSQRAARLYQSEHLAARSWAEHPWFSACSVAARAAVCSPGEYHFCFRELSEAEHCCFDSCACFASAAVHLLCAADCS